MRPVLEETKEVARLRRRKKAVIARRLYIRRKCCSFPCSILFYTFAGLRWSLLRDTFLAVKFMISEVRDLFLCTRVWQSMSGNRLRRKNAYLPYTSLESAEGRSPRIWNNCYGRTCLRHRFWSSSTRQDKPFSSWSRAEQSAKVAVNANIRWFLVKIGFYKVQKDHA